MTVRDKKTEYPDVEMRDDGNDAERFARLLKTVVSVPKEELKKAEERYKREVKKKKG